MNHLLLGFALLALAGCAHRTTAPVPDAAMVSASGTDAATLQRGHAVYLAHCGRCHEPILPADVGRDDWHVVVPGMAWNAGISAEDEEALTAYILAANAR